MIYFKHSGNSHPLHHDIAIIELRIPAITNKNIAIACLPSKYFTYYFSYHEYHFRDFDLYPGRHCMVKGWGSMGNNNISMDMLVLSLIEVLFLTVRPRRLQIGIVPLIDHQTCVESYPGYRSVQR